MPFLDHALFRWVALPLLIFGARIMDVSIGTIRILFLQRGHKLWAPFLGFFEVIIWLLAIRQIMQNLDNWMCYLAYGSGFAMGNYVGMLLEEKLAYGKVVVRVITASRAGDLAAALRKQGHGVTLVDAKGAQGRVDLLFTVIERKDWPGVLSVVETLQPDAFYSIEDTRAVNAGIFPRDGAAPAGSPSPAPPRRVRRFWKLFFHKLQL